MKSDESLYHTTTINPHGMPGRAYVLGNGELNVQVSSPRKPEEPGTNPEQLLGLAQATCTHKQWQQCATDCIDKRQNDRCRQWRIGERQNQIPSNEK